MVKKYEYCTQIREMVVKLHDNGFGYKKINKLLKIPISTKQKNIKKYKIFNTVENIKGRGRKLILTPRATRNILRKVEFNPFITTNEIQNNLSSKNIKVSKSTIQRTLHKNNLSACRPRKTPLLKKDIE